MVVNSQIKNVCVLGGSYSGSRAASVLAEQLPSNYRVILIDRQSHFNHLYKFQRHAVVPGHSHKAFVPFTNLLHAPVLSEEQCPAPSKDSQKELHNIVVQASILNITPTHVEVDSDLCEIEGLSEPELKIQADGNSSRGKVCCCKADGACVGPMQKRCAGTRIPYEYLVYALGSHLPRPIKTDALTKADGMTFLQRQQELIAHSSDILVIGGGALGVQFATDIKSFYPDKKVTLVHSRDRLLPRFEPWMHDQIMHAFKELGVEAILGDRVVFPENGAQLTSKGWSTIHLQSGRSIRSNLRIFATGQKPNSGFLRNLAPNVITDDGYVRVKRTMQLDDPKLPHVFASGDVIDGFGAIKAGHTGWMQADTAAKNILNLIHQHEHPEDPVESLKEYTPGKPQIKVTLGLQRAATQSVKPDDPTQTAFSITDGSQDDNDDWKLTWKALKADPEDPHV